MTTQSTDPTRKTHPMTQSFPWSTARKDIDPFTYSTSYNKSSKYQYENTEISVSSWQIWVIIININVIKVQNLNHHAPHHNRFTALFWDHPGEPVPEQNFWTLWCKGRLTEADTLTIRLRHSIRTNQCPPPPSPIFFTGQMPFLPLNQQCQSTEATSTYGLGRRCWSSPQRCYLHRLCTLSTESKIQQNLLVQ